MFKKIINWLSSRAYSDSSSRSSDEPASRMEGLEERTMLAAVPPHANWVFADNRGQVRIGFDQHINANTLTTKSVALVVNGKKRAIRLYYGNKQLLIVGALPANAPYTIWLNGRAIKGTNGMLLDGEFNGSRTKSGNGTAGGDLVAQAKPYVGKYYAHFETNFGNVDYMLYKTMTATRTNFEAYANAGSWDNGFFHRGVTAGFSVLQGGGFLVATTASSSTLAAVATRPPIVNEFSALLPNAFGTISMARTSEVNSATSQWFFNLANNTALDAANNYYAAFGKVADKSSISVLNSLKARLNQGVYDARVDLGLDPTETDLFKDLPVVDLAAINARTTTSKLQFNDLIMIYRVAMIMNVVKPVAPASAVATPAAQSAVAEPQVAAPTTFAARPVAAPAPTIADVMAGVLSERAEFSTSVIQ